jgi:hypothetical protein
MPLADRAVEWDLSGGTAESSADPRDLAIQWHSDGRSTIVLRLQPWWADEGPYTLLACAYRDICLIFLSIRILRLNN